MIFAGHDIRGPSFAGATGGMPDTPLSRPRYKGIIVDRARRKGEESRNRAFPFPLVFFRIYFQDYFPDYFPKDFRNFSQKDSVNYSVIFSQKTYKDMKH